jgi:hypothetical protein
MDQPGGRGQPKHRPHVRPPRRAPLQRSRQHNQPPLCIESKCAEIGTNQTKGYISQGMKDCSYSVTATVALRTCIGHRRSAVRENCEMVRLSKMSLPPVTLTLKKSPLYYLRSRTLIPELLWSNDHFSRFFVSQRSPHYH